MEIRNRYLTASATPSDINEHLPVLLEYTKKCSSVVECGVRDIVSSWAFAYGLMGVEGNSYTLVDPYRSGSMASFLVTCRLAGVNAEFVNQSDLECPLVKTDLLFIDTWHVYGQLKRELARWNGLVAKYIILHDTTVDGEAGETIRVGWNAMEQSAKSGIPVAEINRGLWPAVTEFLAAHPEWTLERRLTNNNGLTILSRIA